MNSDKELKSYSPSPDVVALVKDLKETLGRYRHLRADEMMAAVSQLLGSILALQDQRYYTPERAMQVIMANLEVGNRAAIELVASAQEGTRN